MLRKIGHKIGKKSIELLKERLIDKLNNIEEYLSYYEENIINGNTLCFTGHTQDGLNAFNIKYLLGDSLEECFSILKKTLPEITKLEVIQKTMYSFDAFKFMNILSASIVCNEPVSKKWLIELPRSKYTPNYDNSNNLERDDIFNAFELNCEWLELLQIIVKQDWTKAKTLIDLIPLKPYIKYIYNPIDKKRNSITNKDTLNDCKVHINIFTILKALITSDNSLLNTAWQEREQIWKEVFKYAKSSNEANPEGIIDIFLLAIGKLSLQRGMIVPNTNLYVPKELLEYKN